MTKHNITVTIDTDNLDLAVTEIESWLADMQYNQGLIKNFTLEDIQDCNCEDKEPQYDKSDLD